MSTFEPDLDLLRQAFGNGVQGCRVELIKTSLEWSRVYRVTLNYRSQGHPAPKTVVVKTIDANGPFSALESERELRFYQLLHPELPIAKPEIHFLATDEPSGFHVMVMEDLTRTHQIPSHPHQWTYEQLKSVLRAYAQLHTAVIEKLDYPWLAPRHESILNFDIIPDQVAAVQHAGIWGELPGLQDLITFARESCRRYANERVILLHGDTTPANAPLPQDPGSQPATLIDWQDVGIGMPEFDLAYIDLQPFESGRLVPRSALLDLYWCYRAELDPDIPASEERHLRQLHADLVFTFWLTASASRVALRPYPEGTYPHMHWASQFGIVYNRLKALVEEVRKV